MKRQIVGRVAVSLLAVSVLCLTQVAPASASGGNAAIAKICQKGGWESLLTPSGVGFTGDGDCVSGGAQGGSAFGVSASVANGIVTYTASGFGLTPDALWGVAFNSDSKPSESLSLSVGASGTVSLSETDFCGDGSSESAFVSSPAITTPTVNSPCG